MCGRFTLSTNMKKVAEHFGLFAELEARPRYNIAPTQDVLVVRAKDTGEREMVTMRWGLVPSWCEGPKKMSLFNARSESAPDKPSFRSAFKSRRCLIPADGFFEWQTLEKGKKQPILFRRPNGDVFSFAGLWETWTDPDGKPLTTCSLMTTSANETVQQFHDRMPVILGQNQYAFWLDPASEKTALRDLLRPAPPGFLNPLAVGPTVNNSRYDGPECVQPLEEAGKVRA